MFKRLYIPAYINEYNAEVNNCIDYMIAGASGKYDMSNYYYYNAWYTIYTNYMHDERRKGYEFRQDILAKIGLQLVTKKINSFGELTQSIKHHIDNGHPVLLPTFYNCLYYDEKYKSSEIMSHWMLFDGYENETDRFLIREFVINSSVFMRISKAHILSEYYLPDEMLLDIYKKTYSILNQCNVESLLLHHLAPIHNSAFYSYKNVVNEFLEFEDKYENQFIKEINSIVKLQEVNGMHQYRRKYHLSYDPLFDSLEKGLSIILDIDDFKVDFAAHRKKFMDDRYIALSILHKFDITKKTVELYKLEKYKALLQENDQVLFAYIRQLLEHQGHRMQNNQTPYNLVPNSLLTCDSEESQIYVVDNIKKKNVQRWEASEDGADHWIIIDFGEVMTLEKIVIHYWENKMFDTIMRSYCIQGCFCNEKWKRIFTVSDNNSAINEIPLQNAKYRKIRIWIPDGPEHYASIEYLEVWGYPI